MQVLLITRDGFSRIVDTDIMADVLRMQGDHAPGEQPKIYTFYLERVGTDLLAYIEEGNVSDIHVDREVNRFMADQVRKETLADVRTRLLAHFSGRGSGVDDLLVALRKLVAE